MKQNIANIIILIIIGACLGFFGLVYWNLSATVKRAAVNEAQINQRLTAIENFLSPNNK